jgi:hypothetical protein
MFYLIAPYYTPVAMGHKLEKIIASNSKYDLSGGARQVELMVLAQAKYALTCLAPTHPIQIWNCWIIAHVSEL